MGKEIVEELAEDQSGLAIAVFTEGAAIAPFSAAWLTIFALAIAASGEFCECPERVRA